MRAPFCQAGGISPSSPYLLLLLPLFNNNSHTRRRRITLRKFQRIRIHTQWHSGELKLFTGWHCETHTHTSHEYVCAFKKQQRRPSCQLDSFFFENCTPHPHTDSRAIFFTSPPRTFAIDFLCIILSAKFLLLLPPWFMHRK